MRSAEPSNWEKEVQQTWWKLEIAPDDVRANKQLVLQAVQQDGLALQYAAEPLRADISIVAEAVKLDGEALRFGAEELRADASLVRLAIGLGDLQSSKGRAARSPQPAAFRHAADSLRGDDKDLIHEVVAAAWWAAEYVLPPIREDPDFWRQVLENNPVDGWMAFGNYAPANMRGDLELLKLALRCDPMAMRYATPEVRHDRDFMLEAVREDWRVLRSAPEELRSDREIILTAACQDLASLEFAEGSVLDEAFLLEAADINARALSFAPAGQRMARGLAEEAARRNGVTLAYAPPELRSDRDLVNLSMRTTLGSCSGLLWRPDHSKKADLGRSGTQSTMEVRIA